MNIIATSNSIPLIRINVEESSVERKAFALMIAKVALAAIFSGTLASGVADHDGEWEIGLGLMGIIINQVFFLSVIPGQVDVLVKAIKIAGEQPEDFVSIGDLESYASNKPCLQVLTSLGCSYIFEEVTSTLLSEIVFLYGFTIQSRYIFLAFSTVSLGICMANIYSFWKTLNE